MERFLIGILGRKNTYGGYWGYGNHVETEETISVPFSINTVKTINVTVQCSLYSSLAQNPYISIFGSTIMFPTFDSNPKTGNVTPISSDIVVNMIWSGYWVINSFTTTDGKVHTASNLNY